MNSPKCYLGKLREEMAYTFDTADPVSLITRAIMNAQVQGVSVSEICRVIDAMASVRTGDIDKIEIRKDAKDKRALWIKGLTYSKPK